MGSWVHLGNALFTVTVGLRMSGFEHSLPFFRVFCALFSVLFFEWVRGGSITAAAPILLFFSPYPKYTCFGFQSYQTCGVSFLWPLL